MRKLNDFIGIKEAARILGVNDDTVRIWCDRGKLKHKRHPINRYYLFIKEDLDNIIKTLQDDLV